MMVQLCKIIWSVHSSPQRRQNWFIEVSRMNARKPALMLILDVKTCWLSTHQMLHKFLISLFIKMNRSQLSQVMPWIIVNLWTILCTLILIFGCICFQMKSGTPLTLLQPGWSHSALQLLRCLWHKHQSSQQHMSFSGAFKTSFMIPFNPYLKI